MSWKIEAKFPIFVRFSIFVNFATIRGVPLVNSFKLSPTLRQFFGEIHPLAMSAKFVNFVTSI